MMSSVDGSVQPTVDLNEAPLESSIGFRPRQVLIPNLPEGLPGPLIDSPPHQVHSSGRAPPVGTEMPSPPQIIRCKPEIYQVLAKRNMMILFSEKIIFKVHVLFISVN